MPPKKSDSETERFRAWYENPENKEAYLKHQILRRIRSGSMPRNDTMSRFNISIADSTSNISDMVGNFNPSMFKKMLYQLNELGGKDGFSSKESIKHFITANRYDINSKHKDVISHGNYLRLFILSNNHTPVEIPYDDRRFVELKVSTAWKGNADTQQVASWDLETTGHRKRKRHVKTRA